MPRPGRQPAPDPLPPPRWLRLLPLLLLLGATAAAFAFGLHRQVGLEALAEQRLALSQWAEANPLLAPALYVALYCAVVACSIPGAAVLSIAGGFLFGTLAGSAYILVGATAGATLVFLAARTALGTMLRERSGTALARMRAGFRENAFSYLLFLRLLPVFPFFVVNVVPALLNVRLPVYVAATLIGIIPGTLVYASVGNGLGTILDAGDSPDLRIIFAPEVLLPLLGLAALALLPALYRRLRAKPPGAATDPDAPAPDRNT